MNKIQRRYQTLNKRISKLYDEIELLQESCQHENLTKKYCSDTGNYDPSQDCYWIEFKCPDCNKRWTEEQ